MNVDHNLLQNIAQAENWMNPSFSRLVGGDINEVFLVSTHVKKYVLKLNNSAKFPQMFEAEKEGLSALRTSNAIIIPEVFGVGEIDETAYLVLEYIPTGHAGKHFWEDFGRGLAALHQESSGEFGFFRSNYIGSLPQYNEAQESASSFYISQRIEPQLAMAKDRGFSFGKNTHWIKNISEEIPQEKSSLIHGDLWSGNFIISEDSAPVLIDPATAYAPREMDIAMMHLFGGFNSTLFEAYHEVFPLQKNWRQRLDIWQLYYLLVHLNIFGSSYLSRVQAIINKYA